LRIGVARDFLAELIDVLVDSRIGDEFRAVIEAVIRIVEKTPDASRPLPGQGLRLRWPPQGYDLEARASRRAGESIRTRKVKVLARTLFYFLVMWSGLRIGRFIPGKYTRELIENSDFRKFDDSLRMVLDCTPELAVEIEDCLKTAAAGGVIRYGMHRQNAAMMTCFTPSPVNPNHVHFIDGAQGGYALAASAPIAMIAAAPAARLRGERHISAPEMVRLARCADPLCGKQ